MTDHVRRIEPTVVAGVLVTISLGLPWFHPDRALFQITTYQMPVRVLLVGAIVAIVVGHVQRGRRPDVAIGALTLVPILLALAVGQYLAAISTTVLVLLVGAGVAAFVARQRLVAARA